MAKLRKISEFGGDLYHADCFDVFPRIDDGAVDMVFCDLPYGVTQVSWDEVLPFPKLWKALERIVISKGAYVLTATQPFTSKIVMSKMEWFRHEWIWEKTNHSNFLNAKVAPLKIHENVVVMSKEPPHYYPILVPDGKLIKRRKNTPRAEDYIYKVKLGENYQPDGYTKPVSIQHFTNTGARNRGLHMTQKPVELCEYFVKTYSKPGQTVLDMTCGSGSLALACINTGRKYICIEKDDDIFKVAEERIRLHYLATARWRRTQAEAAPARTRVRMRK